jgi:hypothetical protein
MEIGAGVTESAGGVSGPGKTELLAIRGKDGMFTLAIWCKFGCRFTGGGLFGFAVGWEMTGGATAKTMRALLFLGGLKGPFGWGDPLYGR